MTQYLAHYGVKGMKWGKRKANPLARSAHENAKEAYTDATENGYANVNGTLSALTEKAKALKTGASRGENRAQLKQRSKNYSIENIKKWAENDKRVKAKAQKIHIISKEYERLAAKGKKTIKDKARMAKLGRILKESHTKNYYAE